MKQTRLLALAALIMPLLCGCGGGGKSGLTPSTGGNTQKRTGSASIQIKWPEQTRIIPLATRSIRIQIKSGDTVHASTLLVRPADGDTSSVRFDGLPEGDLLVVAQAYSNEQGYTTPVAEGTAILTVKDGEESSIKLTMGSTIEKLDLDNNSKFMKVGDDQVALRIDATDRNDYTVVLSPGALRWNSSNPAAVTVDSKGQAKAVGLGVADITVTDTESGKSATFRVSTILDVPTTQAPGPVAININSGKLYVVHAVAGGGLTVLNCTANTAAQIATLSADETPDGLALDKTRNRVLVIAQDDSQGGVLKVFNGTSGALIGETQLSFVPYGVTIDESQNRIYIATKGGIGVVDGQSLRVSTAIALPDSEEVTTNCCLLNGGRKLAVTALPTGGYSNDSGHVYVVDTADYSSVSTVSSTSSGIGGIVPDASGSRAFLLDENMIKAIDGTGSVVSSAQRDYSWTGSTYCYDNARSRLYAIERGYSYLRSWNVRTGESAFNLYLDNPLGIAVNEKTNRLYVSAGYWTNGYVRVVALGS